jgi:hypothetical protein
MACENKKFSIMMSTIMSILISVYNKLNMLVNRLLILCHTNGRLSDTICKLLIFMTLKFSPICV